MGNKAKKLIYRYHQDLLKLENVVGVGYGIREKGGNKTGEDAIVVLVDRKLPSEKLRSRDLIPQTMEDYRTDVIEIGEIQFLNNNLRTSRMRPALPGVSIGHYKITAGTLGAIVRDKNTGKPLILSNNHVLANITNGRDNRSSIGDAILQPGTYDGGSKPKDVIGHLERFIPIERGYGNRPTCPIANTLEKLANFTLHLIKPDYELKFFKNGEGNLVDCAVASPINNKVIGTKIVEIGEIKGTKEPEVGMKVKKSGRTSGITRGKVKVINSTIEVKMTENESAIFHDQFIVDPISKPGDSGSLVVDENNNAVGLLFAGSDKATVCNWIEYVMDELDIEL